MKFQVVKKLPIHLLLNLFLVKHGDTFLCHVEVTRVCFWELLTFPDNLVLSLCKESSTWFVNVIMHMCFNFHCFHIFNSSVSVALVDFFYNVIQWQTDVRFPTESVHLPCYPKELSMHVHCMWLYAHFLWLAGNLVFQAEGWGCRTLSEVTREIVNLDG